MKEILRFVAIALVVVEQREILNGIAGARMIRPEDFFANGQRAEEKRLGFLRLVLREIYFAERVLGLCQIGRILAGKFGLDSESVGITRRRLVVLALQLVEIRNAIESLRVEGRRFSLVLLQKFQRSFGCFETGDILTTRSVEFRKG